MNEDHPMPPDERNVLRSNFIDAISQLTIHNHYKSFHDFEVQKRHIIQVYQQAVRDLNSSEANHDQ